MRLKGTNLEEAKKILEESNLELIFNDDFEQAAATVVDLARIRFS